MPLAAHDNPLVAYATFPSPRELSLAQGATFNVVMFVHRGDFQNSFFFYECIV